MKKETNKKILILTICIFVLNLLIKGFFVTSRPNSIGPAEIDFISQFPVLKNFNPYSLRYTIVILSSLFAFFSFILLYRITKNLLWSFFSGLLLTYSPWIFILSRYSNLYIIILSICISAFLFFYKSKLRLVLIFLFAFISNYLLYQNRMFKINGLIWDYKSIFRLTDFKNLFFVGDYTSSFIRLPKTGFFLVFEVLVFLYGFYKLVLEHGNNKIKKIIIETLIIGIIWFFITPNDIIVSYKGMFIFFSLSLVIAFGYSSLIKRKPVLAWVATFMILFSFIFYQELFYFHFDKKNSGDWGFAEEKISKMLEKNSQNINSIYVSRDASGFIKYLPLFGKHFKNEKIKFVESDWIKNETMSKCLEKKTLCIFKEGDLKLANLEKDDVDEKIYYYNGLPAYFIISKEIFDK